MSLDALYQEIILEHNRKPRNFREMPDANRKVEGHNPLCGDQVTLWLRVDGDRVADVSFQGLGCAISKASASMMTAAVKGKTVAEAKALADEILAMLIGKLDVEKERQALGSLAALSGVSKFPQRVKCASMAWHALETALDESNPEGAAPEPAR
ncbi:MAG: SUF system NifU family Fe-S cluster assembly protein [Gemmatimonadota bacterium]|nr:SUF system NifU family Fe-S cluster assembly protein [Gemmatimonadota bacterium]MDE3215366.1 SUF system NifU family Fe-S cluster assembly protein [Gemmatimonadota bacterium]